MGKRAAYYEVAKNLYVLEERTLEQIADQLGINISTLSRWKQEGNWDEERIRRRADKEHFIDLYNEVRLKLVKKIKALLDSDNPLDSQTLFGILQLLRTIKPAAILELKKSDEEARKATPDEVKQKVIDALAELGISL